LLKISNLAVSSNQRLPNPFRRPLKSSYQPHVRTNAIQIIPVVQELLEMNQIKSPTGFNKEDFAGNGNYGAVCLDSVNENEVPWNHLGESTHSLESPGQKHPGQEGEIGYSTGAICII